MQLTDEQKQQVATWVKGGAGLAEVQKRLAEECGLALKYMDVRFLVIDLGLSVKDKAVPTKPVLPAPTAPLAPPMPAGDDAPLDDAGFSDAGDGAGLGAQVSVDLDRIMKPGSVVSGTVTFSDGLTAAWSLDQYGRLALVPPRPGYQPTPADVQAFQVQLRQALERRGF